jgi:CubicO group peptidase (beta-lactamase class C family)
MKRHLLALGVLCGLLAAPQLSSSFLTWSGPSPQTSKESVLDARIARIENGLVPPVIIKGQPIPAMKIADRMAHYKVPGVSVAFFDHGQILWSRTYGFADVESKKPVTTETLFQAASISKPVSALAALRLVQDGKLSLDDNVNSRLRSWTVPENEFTKEEKVTLRRILSHSAGLTVHGFPGYAAGEPMPTVVQILNGEKPANNRPIRVDTIPGTLWRYSGGGYVIMQLLLTEVTGRPFPQILRDLVLQPAGMTNSTYEQPLPKALAIVAATPYRANGEPVKGGWHTYPEMAPAGLWTTPSDLARLAIEVQNEYAGRSNKILSQEMMRQMLTPQKDNWGLGFGLASASQVPRFSHGGANEGFRCDLEAYESGQGFVIMTNADNGDQLAAEFLGAVAKEYNWPDFQPKEYTKVTVDPKLFDGYVGRYGSARDYIMTITREGDRLFAQVTGQPKFEILPESDHDFFVTEFDAQITFVTESQGRATELIVHQDGTDDHAKRIE